MGNPYNFSFTVESDDAGPSIIALSPADGTTGVAQNAPLVIRLGDEVAVAANSISVVVDGTRYVFAGAAENGATYAAVANSFNGYDITVQLPTTLAVDQIHFVQVVASDGVNPTTYVYSFRVGLLPRVLSVVNVGPDLLMVKFNVPMADDAAIRTPSNYAITPVSAGAAELTITEALFSSSQPDTVVLRYEGGGSTYSVSINNILAASGLSLEYNGDTAEFEIIYKGQPAPRIRLFDTIYGPIGVSQVGVTRRTVDGLVINRAIANATDIQMKKRLAGLWDGTYSRDPRPGARRA